MFKFKKNEIFRNTLRTYPKYVFKMYNGKEYVNNDIRRDDGTISLQDLNLKTKVSNNSILYNKTASNDAVIFDFETTTNADGDDFLDGFGVISAWIYVQPGSTQDEVSILNIGEPGTYAHDFFLYTKNSETTPLALGCKIGDSTNYILWKTSKDILEEKKWHHVAAKTVSDGLGVQIFVDGERVTAYPAENSGPDAYDPAPLTGTIGNVSGTWDRTFNGYIDEVSLFSRALVESDIRRLYNEGQPSDINQQTAYIKSKIVSHWTMGDGDDSDPDILDIIADNHATMSNIAAPYGIVYASPEGRKVEELGGIPGVSSKINEHGAPENQAYFLPLRSKINYSLIKHTTDGGDDIYDEKYTDIREAHRLSSLKNTLDFYRVQSKYYDMKYYLNYEGLPTSSYKSGVPTNDHKLSPAGSTNIVSIPKIFYGHSLRKGSINLKCYLTGTLVAEATDLYKNGEIIEITGSTSGSVIGVALYDEGVLLLTGSSALNTLNTEPYVQPLDSSDAALSDNLKWIYFGSHKIKETGGTLITASSYILEFDGIEKKDTLMMFAHAPKNKLNYSNNASYLEAGQGNKWILATGSGLYWESETIKIKNTISSSFANHSASYEPQTFINKISILDDDGDVIAVARLATPVRKTNDIGYTFKLKLDM